MKAYLILLFFSIVSCKPTTPIGSVESKSISSSILQREVAFQVYLPKDEGHMTQKFPVIYFLHGHGGDEKDWFEANEGNIQVFLDSLINNKKIPPVIAVTLNAGNSWYVDRPEPMETFYLEEFIRFIESTYPINSNLGRIAAGDSAGGYGALRFSLLKPGLFDAVILLSPASYEPLPPAISSSRKVAAFTKDGEFNDSIWNAFSYTHRWQNLVNAPKKPKYYLSVGDDDVFNIVPVVTTLQQQMLQDRIPNELRITNGGHDWTCWQLNFTEALDDFFSE